MPVLPRGEICVAHVAGSVVGEAVGKWYPTELYTNS